MKLRILLATALVVATSAAAAPADAPILDVETVAELATERAASLVALQRTVDDAAAALGWRPYRDDLSLSLTGSLTTSDFSSLESSGSAVLAASIDVLPQLTVTGEIAGRLEDPEPPQGPEPLAASLGLTLEPLADAGGTERNRIALERAELALRAEARTLSHAAIAKLLDALIARDELALAEEALAIARMSLASAEALAERDRATADQLERARDSLRAARQSRDRKELAASRAAWSLAAAIGLPESAFALPAWDELALGAAVEDIRVRGTALEAERLAEQTHTVRAAAIDLHAAEVELAATRRFTPELSAGADVELPGPTYSLSLGFTVRPSDWDGSAKAQAAEDVRFAEIDLETARTATEYAARSALLELDLALEDLDAAAHDRALAEQALAEARFRFGRGGVTRLAVARAELALEKAAAARDAARATVVARWYEIDLVQF